MAAISYRRSAEQKSGRVGSRIVHSVCTGNPEKAAGQKLRAASEEGVGMLRLRKKDRFALLLPSLSMTTGFFLGPA